MNYIDTHCHLNFPQFHHDMEGVINETFKAGVIKVVNIGTNLQTSKESVNLASRYKNIIASVGIHPHDAKTIDANALKQLESLAKDSKVVAVGEIGLDYFRNFSAKEHQKQAFIKQLQMAIRLEKPIIIHCRDAYGDILNILDEIYLPHLKRRLPGVIHSFSSGPKYLKEFLKRGFYIGFNGMITYPGNEQLIEAVRTVPINKLLIETDAPFLAPQNYRGQRNEPKWVIDVARMVAEIKHTNIDEVAKLTTDNAMRLFELK